MTLIVLAAGLGSRFGGPKQFFPLGPNGECLFHYSLYHAVAHGFDRLLLVTREELVTEAEQAIADVPVPAEIVVQECPDGKPRGTADAVAVCADRLERDTVVVLNADDYYGPETLAAAQRLAIAKRDAAAVPYPISKTLSDQGGVSRAICELENDRIIGIRETQEVIWNGTYAEGVQGGTPVRIPPGALVSMNVFIMSPDLVNEAAFYVNEEVKYGIPSEITIPDFLQSWIERYQLAIPVEISHEEWFGLTFAEDLPLVKQKLARLHESGCVPDRLW